MLPLVIAIGTVVEIPQNGQGHPKPFHTHALRKEVKVTVATMAWVWFLVEVEVEEEFKGMCTRKPIGTQVLANPQIGPAPPHRRAPNAIIMLVVLKEPKTTSFCANLELVV